MYTAHIYIYVCVSCTYKCIDLCTHIYTAHRLAGLYTLDRGGIMCVYVCVCVRMYVCVRVCVTHHGEIFSFERHCSLCTYVCVRERDREFVCVCALEYVCVRVSE